MIAPSDSKPSSDSAQPCWNTSTSTPYAAPTESRFRTIAFSGTTIDRNATSSNRNASASTNTITYGTPCFICRVKSTSSAVAPVTAVSTPGTRPSVAGTRSFRRISIARRLAALSPPPVSGSSSDAPSPSGPPLTVNGECAMPRATASFSSRSSWRCAASRCSSGPAATTNAGSDVAGNAARTRANVASSGSFFADSALSLGFETRMPSAGSASATSNPAESAHDSAGRRRTRSITAGQKRECVWSLCRCGRNGIRPRSIFDPSSSSTPGRTVTEPTTAHRTTAIVPLASPLKVFEPMMYMPAMAIATVVPETITVRPDVRAVSSSASCDGRPRRRSCRDRMT